MKNIVKFRQMFVNFHLFGKNGRVYAAEQRSECNTCYINPASINNNRENTTDNSSAFVCIFGLHLFDLINMAFAACAHVLPFLQFFCPVQKGLGQQQMKAQHQQSAKINGKNIHDIKTEGASQVFAFKCCHQNCFERDEQKFLKE